MSVFNIKNLPKNSDIESHKPLIMLVDDEIENINVLRQLLEENFQIITGLNGAEAIDLIDNMVDPTKIQLIITDQRMPIVTGVEFLEKIVDRMPDTIRIILTGYSDTQVIIDAINKAKLYKFMTKPFDPVELSMTVKRGVEAYQMRKALIDYAANLEQLVEERTEKLNEKNEALNQALNSLEQLSMSDQLTGVHNRHFLDKFMPQELSKLKRSQADNSDESIGFLMIDIDLFKKVNDSYGHDAGDKVLVQFTKILGRSCRESDWLIRWGGEEFVIVARGQSIEGLEQLAERIRIHVEIHLFDLGCQQTINCSCSIGITCFPFLKNHFDSLTWEQTLNFADLALYLAKNNGRNTWVSLIENASNIDNQLTSNHGKIFYERVMTNLVDLIEQKQVLYHTPILDKQLKF
ncbi:diguanylate cyclase [Colwellia piezophila]|uniref:diguanylate cyclase n=1 Tax=Colwellia piezophila TaxID=211668 RepID=UPI000364D51A|nr:diguanylate cyclase [Colwellia piezophila]